MDGSVFTDTSKFQGIWFKIHIDGMMATNDALKDAFIININALCDNFKCKKCQPHFRKFIDTHNFKDYWNIKNINGKDIGFFKWTWELHNQVNKFLGKYQPSLEEAYNFYSNAEIGACSSCKGGPEIETNFNITDITNEMITKSVPPILTLYRKGGDIKPKPFRLISRTQKH
jgi:hypothetical protein